jgi:F-type H+-transporting ATPase subunit epsilon
VRLNLADEAGGGVLRVLVSGGYAEVDNDEVIVLADHARREDEIDLDRERAGLAEAMADRDRFGADDVRRAHYDNTVRWCQQLIDYAESHKQGV